MAGCVVMVWFEPDADIGDPRMPFKVIETEFPDFTSFCQFADGDRLIGGAILYTRKLDDGTREIIRRVPLAFRGSAVRRCELPRMRYVEVGQT